MPFSIHLFRCFPVQFTVTYNAEHGLDAPITAAGYTLD